MMRTPFSLGLGAALLLLSSAARAASPSWTQSLSGPADGASYGDVDGDGLLEIALIVRGNPGRVVLMNHAGTVLWTHTGSSPLYGFPTFGDYDGNGTQEVSYCESGENGACRVLNADGSVRYSFGDFYYVGMSGSGPSAADVNGDGADDILVMSWGGRAVLVDGATGSIIWSYDAWGAHGEVLFGPSTFADLDGDGTLEVVFGGWLEGTLFVLDAVTGTEEWAPIGLNAMWGGQFYGNGALVEDLDRDGTREIVVGLDGDPPSVAAFSSTGGSLWRTALGASASFAWLTPVASDLDADGTMEILAQSGDGTLYVMDAGGNLLAAPSVGVESWIAPAFIDVDFDLQPEIVAASIDSLLVLDGQTFAELDRYDDPSGGIYPQILVGDFAASGEVGVVTGSWNAPSVSYFNFGAADVASWSSLGGGPSHPGGVELVCQSVCSSVNASVDGSANLGDGVLIGPNATVGSRTNIGHDVIIGAGATVQQQSTIRPDVTIGENATVGQQSFVGRYSSVGEGSVVGQESVVGWNVDIGAGVNIGQQTLIWGNADIGQGTSIAQETRVGWGVSIGENVTLDRQVILRPNVTIGAGTVIGRETRIGRDTTISANVTIGRQCRIGRNVTIGDGVVIPDGTVVPNGAVLP